MRLRHVVLMGVSGTGKSTVGVPLAEALAGTFADGDDFHPDANVAKMASGEPLTDEDRWPWLHALADWTRQQHEAGRSTVLACSALRRAYRDVLRGGARPTYFVHLTAPADLIRQRMQGREHFMPAALLESQLATLEPLEPDEAGLAVDVRVPVADVLARILADLRAGPGGVSRPGPG